MTRWLFGSCELDSELFELRRNDRVLSAQRRLLQILIHLAANTHRVVPKDELIKHVWSGTAISEASLRSAVRDARALLGDDQELLRSVRGYGYQLSTARVDKSSEHSLKSPADEAGDARTILPDNTNGQELAPPSAPKAAVPEREQHGAFLPAQLPVKVSEPALGQRIARTRLFNELDAALERRIVWIMGPAGAGKTTLVRTYAEAKDLPRIWYRVDDSDIDVASLFFYLGQALPPVTRKAGMPIKELPLLAPQYTSGLTTAARRYFEALYAQLPRPCLMVFDNYQDVASEAPWHQVIREAASSVPPGINLIFISRGEPPASLARQRAHDEMAILGWEALRLSRDEAVEMADNHESRLDAATAGELHALSDGWAAGFTALLNQARSTKQRAPEVLLEHASQTIFDYFATELFEHMPADEQQFLLKTAVLPHMTEQLARDLAGFEEAGRALARLYRQNLFIERRDMAPPVYEYHPLFRQFLLERGKTVLGDEPLRDLRCRAGEALCQGDQVEAGLELLWLGGHYQACVPWLLAQAPALIGQGRARTLESWIARLPAELVDGNGWLSYWYGMCCLGHQPTDSVARLRRAFELSRESGDRTGAYLAWAGVVRAITFEGMLCAPLDEWILAFETLGPAQPDFPSIEVEAQVASAMLEALAIRAPAAEKTRVWAKRVLSLAGHVRSPAERCIALGSVVHHSVLFGNLNEAVAILELLKRALASNIEPIARAAVRLAQASYAHLSGDNEACMTTVRLALQESKSTGVHVLDDFLCALAASATLSVADTETAGSFLDMMARNAGRNRFARGNYCFYRSWEAVVLGDFSRATSLIKVAADEADIMDYPLARMSARFGWGRILCEARQFNEALDHLNEAKRLSIDYGCQPVLRGALLAEADTAFSTNRRSEACALLAEAMTIGKLTGVANMFFLPHEVLRRLHRQALSAGFSQADLKNLITPLRPSADNHLKRIVGADPAPS